MIDRQEVLDFAREFGLAANVVEKDYVLGWLLAGISHHTALNQRWVFKGGTCLKKCYFETYRFSEDLDFTLTDPAQLEQEFLVRAFSDIADWIYDQSGIEIPRDSIRFDIYQNNRGGVAAEGRIGYRGPMQRRGDPARVKLDLTSDEVLVHEPVDREVHHPYSDRPTDGIHIHCYGFEEVFAEKTRALAERLRPRDLYDVVHLYRHDSIRPDRALVLSTLERKCAFKGIDVPTMASLASRPERAELEAEWGNMLRHQLSALPPFDQFWSALPAVFDWLQGVTEKAAAPAIQTMGAALDEAWQPPAMAQAWHAPVPLEVIRFAAANHLCVNLAYQGTQRLIEPYSLRRTRDGNLLLYAVKHETDEIRAYRVDRIEGAEATSTSFVPRYAVELTPHMPISAPRAARSSSDFGPSRLGINRPRRRPARTAKSSFGPKYVFQCTLCGKRFTRKSYNASLNPHKDKRGYPCLGRIGTHVTTKY